jgi:hypothetical protein
MLLVTGCGRSGTAYAARWFDVGHEVFQPHRGISSWYMAPPIGSVPRTQYGVVHDVDFDRVVHLVRHPLQAITSIMTLNEDSWSYVEAHIGSRVSDTPLVRAMRYWLDWNQLAEARATAAERGIVGLRVETLKGKGIPRNLNTRPHREYTASELATADGGLFMQIMVQASRYGYSRTSWR